MTKKQLSVEVANLVVNFGKSGLLDNFKDTIFPVIQTRTAKGRGEAKEYRFHRTMVHELPEDNVPVLTGRLVTLMNLKAVQEYDRSRDELVDSQKTMASAPSSFFSIDLASHRMIWIREASRAPTIQQFEGILRRILKEEIKQRREAFKADFLRKRERSRLTASLKKELEEQLNAQLPFPTVRITALPAIKEVDESVDALEKIERLYVKPLETNNELPDENEEFLRKHFEQAQRLNGTSYVPFFSHGEEGMAHEEVKRLTKAAADGNYQIKIQGQTTKGNKVSAELEQLSISLPIDTKQGESNQDLAKRAYDKVCEAQVNGWLKLPQKAKDLITKARTVVNYLLGKD